MEGIHPVAVPLPLLEKLSLDEGPLNTQPPMSKEPRTLLTLPTEILEQILGHLPDISLHAFSLTCKSMQEVANSEHLWHNLLSRLYLKSPHPYPSYRRLHRSLAPYLFLPRKLFFGDREVHGHLLVCKYLSMSGTIEAFALIEDKPRSKRPKSKPWSQDPEVTVYGFEPKVRLWEETELKISPDSRRSESGEIPQPRAARGIFASFMRAKMIVGSDLWPSMNVWPPFCVPAEERVRNQSVTKFNDPRHNPSAVFPSQIASGAAAAALPPIGNIDDYYDELATGVLVPGVPAHIKMTPFDSPPPAALRRNEAERWKVRQPHKSGYASKRSFRLRKWTTLGNMRNISYNSGTSLRIGEKVETYSEVDEELWTPTPEYPYRGIWLGDYERHGAQFFLFYQPAKENPDEPSELRAIKLTGDPAVKRGEIAFTVGDVTPSSAIRRAPHYEFEWPNALIFSCEGPPLNADQIEVSLGMRRQTLPTLFIVPEKQMLASEKDSPTCQSTTGLPHPSAASSRSNSSSVSLAAGRDGRAKDPGAGWGVGRKERDPAPKSDAVRYLTARIERRTAAWVKREVVVGWEGADNEMRRFKRVDVDDLFD